MVYVDLERRTHTTRKFENERSLRLSIMTWAGIKYLKISLLVEPRRWMIEMKYKEMKHLDKITPEFCDSERENHHVHQAWLTLLTGYARNLESRSI